MDLKTRLLTISLAAAGTTTLYAAPNPGNAPPARPPQQQNAEPAARAQAGSAAAAAPLSPASSVDQVLDALDARGHNLQSFVADVTLAEEDTSLAFGSTRTGRVWYQARGDNPRIHVIFDQKIDGKRKFPEKVEYLLQDGWLTDRDYQKKIEVRRQVLRPGQKANLLKLGEGPFPLPIGQKREEVLKQFTATKGTPAKDDPPGTAHVQLKPREQSEFKSRIGTMDVWVDPQTNFPAKIEVVDPDGAKVRTTVLKNLRVNPQPPIGDAEFALPAVQGWDLHDEPFQR